MLKCLIKSTTHLTCNPAKNQPLAQIRKFKFEKLFALVSMLWYLKYIDIPLTFIWAPLWGPGDPKVPRIEMKHDTSLKPF